MHAYVDPVVQCPEAAAAHDLFDELLSLHERFAKYAAKYVAEDEWVDQYLLLVPREADRSLIGHEVKRLAHRRSVSADLTYHGGEGLRSGDV